MFWVVASNHFVNRGAASRESTGTCSASRTSRAFAASVTSSADSVPGPGTSPTATKPDAWSLDMRLSTRAATAGDQGRWTSLITTMRPLTLSGASAVLAEVSMTGALIERLFDVLDAVRWGAG